MTDTTQIAQVSDPSARDDIASLREDFAALGAKFADLSTSTSRVAIVCERSLVLAERATNIAEASNERAIQIMAAQSQIQTALNVVIQQYGVIKTIGEKNAEANVDMRETVATLSTRLDDMHAEVAKMKEDLYVALGTSKTAEEIAGEATKKAAIATKEAEAAKLKTRALDREVAKLHDDVEHLDERIDITHGKKLSELEAHRQKSEADLKAQADEGREIARKRAEALEKFVLDEAAANRKREEWERQQEERKLAMKNAEAERRWAAWGKVLAPAVLIAIIGAIVTIAGKC